MLAPSTRPSARGELGSPPFLLSIRAGPRTRQASGVEKELDLALIRSARRRIAPYVLRTPVLRCAPRPDLELFCKAESLQPTGAFKLRGAFSLMTTLPRGTRGVVAHSSGNHAQAVARAARVLGLRAVIAISEDAPALKVARTAADGAEIVMVPADSDLRARRAAEIAAEQGLVPVPPFEHRAGRGGTGHERARAARGRGDARPLLLPGVGRRAAGRLRGRAARAGARDRDRRGRARRREPPRALARRRRAAQDPAAAHDRRRPARAHPGRAHLAGAAAARRAGRARLGRRAARRDGLRAARAPARARARGRRRARRRAARGPRPLRRAAVRGQRRLPSCCAQVLLRGHEALQRRRPRPEPAPRPDLPAREGDLDSLRAVAAREGRAQDARVPGQELARPAAGARARRRLAPRRRASRSAAISRSSTPSRRCSDATPPSARGSTCGCAGSSCA